MRLSSAKAYHLAKETLLKEKVSLAEAQQLFQLADFFRAQPRLARALVDQTRTVADRGDLFAKVNPIAELTHPVQISFEQLLSGSIPQETDLYQALEELGIDAVIAQLDSPQAVIQVVEELYGVVELFQQERELRGVLGERKTWQMDSRLALAKDLFGEQLSRPALLLLQRAIATTAQAGSGEDDHCSLDSRLRHYQNRLGESQALMLALVRCASPLEPAQIQRLETILTQRYQRQVHLHLQVRPELVGGLQVQIGSEIYDGALRSVIEHTRQQIAS